MLIFANHRFNQTPELYPVFGVKGYNHVEEYVLATHGTFLNFYETDQFEVQDSRESGFWNSFTNGDCELKIFPEWVETYFYENLENDAPRETQLVQLYCDFLMREFSRENHLSAIDLEYENWCQCPECEGIFEVFSYFGMIKCPNCFLLQNNPFENHKKLYTSDEVLQPREKYVEYANAFYFTETGKYYPSPPHCVVRKGKVSWEGDEINRKG